MATTDDHTFSQVTAAIDALPEAERDRVMSSDLPIVAEIKARAAKGLHAAKVREAQEAQRRAAELEAQYKTATMAEDARHYERSKEFQERVKDLRGSHGAIAQRRARIRADIGSWDEGRAQRYALNLAAERARSDWAALETESERQKFSRFTLPRIARQHGVPETELRMTMRGHK